MAPISSFYSTTAMPGDDDYYKLGISSMVGHIGSWGLTVLSIVRQLNGTYLIEVDGPITLNQLAHLGLSTSTGLL